MNNLFDGDSDDNEVSFKTENEYAKKYDNWREKEELHKLEQKYGDKPLDTEDSESDSEDESDEPLEVSEETEKQFLKTLSLLKKKDPRIYNPDFKFFDNTVEDKPKNEIKEEETVKPKKEVKSLAAAFADSDDDDGEELFTVEKGPQITDNKDNNSIKQYLTGDAPLAEDEEDLAPLKALWSDPKLNDGEAFLRDYILNKKYLEVSEPTSGTLDAEGLAEDEARVEEQGQFERAYNFRFEEPDQDFLKRYPRTLSAVRPKDDRRSRKRAETRTRKEQEKQKKMEEIARLKALKSKEIQEKINKIKQVTGNDQLAFQESDIEGEFDPAEHDRKMKAIFDEEYYGDVDEEKPVFPDLDEELEIENWENYDEQTADDHEQDEPHCEDEDFNMDADYDPKRSRTNLMNEIKETLGKKKRNRKRKSKLAELLSVEKPKFIPGEEKTYDQYMEEYYKLDCEDIIAGDLPTRFKYREVVPNSFGLTIEEILLADDKELNGWASLKKTVKYRPDHIEKSEVKTYKQRAADLNLKRKLLPSLFKDIAEEPELVVKTKAKKKKTKSKKKNVTVTSEDIQSTNISQDQAKSSKKKNKDNSVSEEISNKNMDLKSNGNLDKVEETSSKKKHKNKELINGKKDKLNNKRKLDTENNADNEVEGIKKKIKRSKRINVQGNKSDNPLAKLSDERLKAFGLNPKKYRGFLKYKKF